MKRLVLVSSLTALLVSCGPAFERPMVTGPLAASDSRVAQGERVFYENCHACHPHGGRGIGKGVADRPLPAFAVRLQVRHGLGEMPAFSEEEIDAEEMDALLAYLSELRMVWAAETP
ncbi:MAG TPA: cytochrome c [Trueperaceae bacterium]